MTTANTVCLVGLIWIYTSGQTSCITPIWVCFTPNLLPLVQSICSHLSLPETEVFPIRTDYHHNIPNNVDFCWGPIPISALIVADANDDDDDDDDNNDNEYYEHYSCYSYYTIAPSPGQLSQSC